MRKQKRRLAKSKSEFDAIEDPVQRVTRKAAIALAFVSVFYFFIKLLFL